MLLSRIFTKSFPQFVTVKMFFEFRAHCCDALHHPHEEKEKEKVKKKKIRKKSPPRQQVALLVGTISLVAVTGLNLHFDCVIRNGSDQQK